VFDPNAALPWLEWTGIHVSLWKLVGLAGASMFGLRWLVQLVASHRAGRPVIPRVFWIMSLAGSLMALSYFLGRGRGAPEPVPRLHRRLQPVARPAAGPTGPGRRPRLTAGARGCG
jgi:hypothetical protein